MFGVLLVQAYGNEIRFIQLTLRLNSKRIILMYININAYKLFNKQLY